MKKIKRFIADIIESASGSYVVPPREVAQLHEKVHLKSFFQHFSVDCVFDVGANEGQYAELLRKKIGFRGPIISYEPIPELAAILEKKAKSDPNWYIDNSALDSMSGPATFNIMVDSQFSSFRDPASDQEVNFQESNKISRSVQINRKTLATEFPYWQKKLGFQRAYLKMDTQGNDLQVVKGAGDLIRSFIGLQSEISFRKIYEDAIDYSESISAYISLGFVLSALVPNNGGHFPLLVEMDCIMFRKS